MSNLGVVTIYIDKGQTLCGIALSDGKNNIVAGSTIKPSRPEEGDRITVEFKYKP